MISFSPLPAAWIGYALVGGRFGVKICPKCPDYHKALADAKAGELEVKLTLCRTHYQQELTKRIGT